MKLASQPLVLLMLAAGPVATAAQWTAAPSLSATMDSNSNRRLDFVARDSQALLFDASLALRRATETLDIAMTPRFSVRRYQGETVLDSNDYGLAIDASHTGELSMFGLQASASRDSTLTSELRDTGIIEGRQQRQALVGVLSASRAITARTALSATAGWQDISYQNAAASGLVDYSYPNASVAVQWQYSPRLRLSLRADGSQLRAPAIASSSSNHAERLIADAQLSERLNLNLTLGQSATSARAASDRGLVYSAALQWRGQLTELSLSAGRDVVPSGRGVLVARDAASAAWSRRLSERFSLSANASLDRNEDLLFGFIRNNRRYWSADAALNWRFAQAWTLSARLSSARADFELLDRQARSQGAALVFAWTPMQRTTSR